MSEKPFGQWKVGNEFLPYHWSASHVEPRYRDGWNHCYEVAQARIAELQAQVEQLRTEAKVASDRIQELGRFTRAQRGEIEGLRADLSRTERNRDMWKEQCARQAEQLETGILHLNAAQDDAQRYRWLRHGDNDELVLCRGPVDMSYVYLPRNEKLDAAIDSARAGREDGNGR